MKRAMSKLLPFTKCGTRYCGRGIASLLLGVTLSASGLVYAQDDGGTPLKDVSKWIESNTGDKIKLGVGFRGSVRSVENGSTDGDNWKTDGQLDNMRLYVNAKMNEHFAVEFNTEWDTNNNEEIRVLDGVLKYSKSEAFNIWLGRHLPPSDRSNLDGPYYLATYDYPGMVSRYPSIFAGRDDGLSVSGQFEGGKLKYAVGAYKGTDNPNSNQLFAGRFTYNFLDPEPGYYTSSTYYGAKDVFAIGLVLQYQGDGADAGVAGVDDGTEDFLGYNVDVLFEKGLSNDGVITVEGAAYRYDLNGVDGDGEAFMGLLGYLIPKEVGPGKFQPHVRYQTFEDDFTDQTLEQFDVGVNYVIDGHNARLSLVYSLVDTRTQDDASQIVLGAQFQF